MKLKNGYNLLAQNEGYIICSNGKPLENRVVLSEIGAFLWKSIEQTDLSNNEMLTLLLDNFQISTVLALGEIDTFIKRMKENGIFE